MSEIGVEARKLETNWLPSIQASALIKSTAYNLRLPESPRWLLIHGRHDEAQRIVEGIEGIEARLRAQGHELPEVTSEPLRLHARDHTPLAEIFHTLFIRYTRRALVGMTLLTAQAFFYNAIFFTYALVLTDFTRCPQSTSAGTYCPWRWAISAGRCCWGGCST
jgi:hypothetical protein